MNADKLLDLLRSKNNRRQEKVTHLGLDHQPVIYELMVSEKEEIQKRINEAETAEEKHDIAIETVIKSMCGWDDAGEVTQEHIDGLKQVYSADVIVELYQCVADFGYLGEQGIAKAK